MGNGAAVQGSSFKSWRESLKNSFKFGKKVERREILHTVNEILQEPEAMERVETAVRDNQPGTPDRWERMLAFINTNEEPTKENKDPLRVEIDDMTLKSLFAHNFDSMTTIASSDGLALSREYLPKMYDKHSVERGKRVSQREREERGLREDCYAYGELDAEIFATIYIRVTTVYGVMPEGSFYDLGCGVGALVYMAALIGSFKKVVGIDNLNSLIERGERRLSRWEKFSDNFTAAIKNVTIDFIEDDFLLSGFWNEGTFILLHWTAFNSEQRLRISSLLAACAEGTQVLSFTHPIPGDDFEVLIQDQCKTSWGLAEFFFQEKITAARNPDRLPSRRERIKERERAEQEKLMQQQQQQLQDAGVDDDDVEVGFEGM